VGGGSKIIFGEGWMEARGQLQNGVIMIILILNSWLAGLITFYNNHDFCEGNE